MAIAKIKKIQIIAHQTRRQELLEKLQRLAVVHIVDIKELLPAEEKNDFLQLPSEKDRDLERDFQETSYALELMRSYEIKKGGKSFLKERPLVRYENIEDIVEDFDYRTFLGEIFRIDARLKHIKSEQARIVREIEALTPLIRLEAPLDEIRPTHKTNILLGAMPKERLSALFDELKQVSPAFYMQRISEDKAQAYALVMYLKENEEKTAQALRKNNFSFVFMPQFRHSPLREIKRLESEFEATQAEEKQLEDQILRLSAERFKLMVLHDYLLGIRQRQEAASGFAATQKAFLAQGWINKADIKVLEKGISDIREAEILISDPGPKEDIPTLLENKPVAQPFEVVTDMYGKPVYKGVDPTPYLAPFFAIFFGVCITDAGYGIALSLASLFMLKKLKLGIAGKRFLRLMFISGLATIVMGILTGGFFGDITSKIPALGFLEQARKRLMVLDPMEKPIIFLGFAIILGYIQVMTGVTIRLVKDIMRRDWHLTFFSNLPVFMIQAELLFLALAVAGILPGKQVFPVLAGVFIFSSLLIMANQFIINRDWAQKIFWAVFAVYGVVTGNCLADILSYSRLFALGLTTGLLALAINNIVYILADIPYIGILLACIVFLGGHVFNMAINILGGYVHTSRLQYLEFFSKFFEGGGKPFKPFRIESKYTVIVEK